MKKSESIQNQALHEMDPKVYYVDTGDVPPEEVIKKLESLRHTFPKKFNNKGNNNGKQS